MSAEKFYGSPRWSGEVADCSMPMTFDTYSNCSYNCAYCFSFFQRAISTGAQAYLDKKVKWVNVERVKRIFTEPESSEFWRYIEQRRPIQWGGLSDQFDEYERRHGKTLELLRFFREIEYPISFSTKAAWWSEDERYLELFTGAPFWNLKVSIITLDAEKARLVEGGCPSPAERLQVVRRISERNPGGVTLRLRPFIIGMSDPTHKRLIRTAGEMGATAVSTEFFCLETRAADPNRYDPISKAIGRDVKDYYRKYSYGAGYQRLNRNLKRPFVDEMEDAAREAGMRFYVSDAHFKERCHNGSCCGLDESWNYTRGQWCEALMIAREKGEVSWGDVKSDLLGILEGIAVEKAVHFTGPEGRAKYWGFDVPEYVRWCWNNPKSGKSPYRYFEGILKPVRLDENGDVVYAYDEERA